MKRYNNNLENLLFIISIVCLCVSINSLYFVREHITYIPIMILLYIIGCILPIYSKILLPNRRFKICNYGTKMLKIVVITSIVAIIYLCVLAYKYIQKDWVIFVGSIVAAIILEAIIFWIGIICVYCTSTQLGVKIRTLGIICGMIPVANLVMLSIIIITLNKEINFEWNKYVLNINRREDKICETKYPLLLVHGVFFRDSEKFNYWGRIPKELEDNGATIYYGEHQSALSIKESAKELADRIRTLIEQTGCEKINIIAHSKGGLDCRYAIYKYELEPYIASLTTINSPHKGCKFADYLLNNISEDVKNKVANTYNNTLKKLGDKNPDFLAAVSDLTSSRCQKFDEEVLYPKGIFCQSSGSRLKYRVDDNFPMNFSYAMVKKYDGYNDGLVGEDAFEFGDKYMFLTTKGKYGISHGDVIDLNRKNIEDYDVREWYVQLVADLKNRGY